MSEYSRDLTDIFGKLKELLIKRARGPVIGLEAPIGSKVKGGKPSYHLYGKKEVSIMGRKPQQTYISGIILQKNFVGFYSMPVYSHPDLLGKVNPATKKLLKGKSCFNVKYIDRNILRDIDALVGEGIELYRKEGWI